MTDQAKAQLRWLAQQYINGKMSASWFVEEVHCAASTFQIPWLKEVREFFRAEQLAEKIPRF